MLRCSSQLSTPLRSVTRGVLGSVGISVANVIAKRPSIYGIAPLVKVAIIELVLLFLVEIVLIGVGSNLLVNAILRSGMFAHCNPVRALVNQLGGDCIGIATKFVADSDRIRRFVILPTPPRRVPCVVAEGNVPVLVTFFDVCQDLLALGRLGELTGSHQVEGIEQRLGVAGRCCGPTNVHGRVVQRMEGRPCRCTEVYGVIDGSACSAL